MADTRKDHFNYLLLDPVVLDKLRDKSGISDRGLFARYSAWSLELAVVFFLFFFVFFCFFVI